MLEDIRDLLKEGIWKNKPVTEKAIRFLLDLVEAKDKEIETLEQENLRLQAETIGVLNS